MAPMSRQKKPRLPGTNITTVERKAVIELLRKEIHPTEINEQTGVCLSSIYQIKRQEFPKEKS
jgi:hypothetical protein